MVKEQSPGTDAHKHRLLVLTKKQRQANGEKTVLEQLDIHIQKNDLVTNFTPFKKLTQMDHGSKYKMQKHKASRRLHRRK